MDSSVLPIHSLGTTINMDDCADIHGHSDLLFIYGLVGGPCTKSDSDTKKCLS